MTPVFADTTYFIALISPDDSLHEKAHEFASLVGNLVTTEWVLLELADGLAKTPNRQFFPDIRAQCREDPDVLCIPLGMELYERAIDRYVRRKDKTWSLTDCVSFITMEDRGLKEALTGDRHFEQAGFVALLK